MDRIEDHIFPVVGTGVSGNDPGAATDNHLVDIATDPDFLMAVGDGHGIVIRPVAHQGRLTGALLDRLTHHVHILEMNGESYRLNQSQKRRKSPKIPA